MEQKTVKVKLLHSLANTTRAWKAGELFECASHEDAKRLIDSGTAAPLGADDAEPESVLQKLRVENAQLRAALAANGGGASTGDKSKK